MPSAGKFPMVRGASTLRKFFEAVARHAVPSPGFSMKRWLEASNLRSSYFQDTIAFAAFVGMTDEKGPTELWTKLRAEDERLTALLEALRGAYREPLDFLSLDSPSADDTPRLSSYIRTHENVAADSAEQAAATLIAAFDYALGREGNQASLTPQSSRGGRQSAAPTPKASKVVADVRSRTTPPSMSQATNGQGAGERRAVLAVNLQIVLPPDAPDDKYDAMLGAVARHLSSILNG